MVGLARGAAERAARRSALVLASAQTVVGSAGPIAVSIGCVAAASLLSGRIYAASGWETMNAVVFPVVANCLAALALQAIIRPSAAAEC